MYLEWANAFVNANLACLLLWTANLTLTYFLVFQSIIIIYNAAFIVNKY